MANRAIDSCTIDIYEEKASITDPLDNRHLKKYMFRAHNTGQKYDHLKCLHVTVLKTEISNTRM